jgi:hypothetical protein
MSTLLGSGRPRILCCRWSAVRPNRTPPTTPIAPVKTEMPIVVATLPCSLSCIPLRDAFVGAPTVPLPFCACARGRDRCRLPLAALRRLALLLLARLRVPVPLLVRGVPALLLVRGVPALLLVRRVPVPLLARLLVAEAREALALVLRDPLLLGCLPRPRLEDALGRSDALDPFEDDDERLRLPVLLDDPRSVAAAMVTS